SSWPGLTRPSTKSGTWMPATRPGMTATGNAASPLKKESQVFAQQHVLVEDDFPPRDPPAVAITPEQILALPDQQVGLGLDPVAVDQKAAAYRDLARIGHRRGDLDQLHVRHQVRDP